MRALIFLLLMCSVCQADAWSEFNEWRRRVGLPQLKEDPAMTKFAQAKANYRAFYGLKNGHQGPGAPAGWREGTGEATAMWGWLTCCQEESATHGGAGMCIGWDGERYMVLVVRGGTGRCLLRSRNNIPIRDTSHMTKKPYRVTRRTKDFPYDIVRGT